MYVMGCFLYLKLLNSSVRTDRFLRKYNFGFYFVVPIDKLTFSA